MIYRCIAPNWLKEQNPDIPRVVEGDFSEEEAAALNEQGYNIYFLPNSTSFYDPTKTVEGSQIDTFKYCFVDMDLKDGVHTKESFLAVLSSDPLKPTFVVDSGNGLHAYWQVTDLDAMGYLKLTRRLMRRFNTDPAVGQLFQLMRAPLTVNTKDADHPKLCEIIQVNEAIYTSEQLDNALPLLTQADEAHCKQHFDKTYHLNSFHQNIDDKIPLKFNKLVRSNLEAKELWQSPGDDRSKSDYRLGHIMFANGFTRAEAASVLVNCPKALSRAPVHRMSYAEGILDKIWTYEILQAENDISLSKSVLDILRSSPDAPGGERFRCSPYLDATHHGFRLGQVMGLVAGSGVGKTAMALNLFKWFVERNPDCDHLFVPLEQPAREIAERWKTLCGNDETLHPKVHVMSNYDDDGSFRHLSFDEIKDHILKLQRVTGKKIGCVVIDHIGALKKKGKDGENQDLMDICHAMKAFAIQTNTMLVMQSQAPREKAGIGDLELNKDAAYGTVYFESYCDYLITLWQPLKRLYHDKNCPTVTAFKFCKIRHKKRHKDEIQEDTCYRLAFDPESERFREMTQVEEEHFGFWNSQCLNLRKADRKTDLVPYKSMTWLKGEEVTHAGKPNSGQNGGRSPKTSRGYSG